MRVAIISGLSIFSVPVCNLITLVRLIQCRQSCKNFRLNFFNFLQAKRARQVEQITLSCHTPINNIVSRANDQIKSLITLSHAELSILWDVTRTSQEEKSINHDLNHSANATFLHITMGCVIVFGRCMAPCLSIFFDMRKILYFVSGNLSAKMFVSTIFLLMIHS